MTDPTKCPHCTDRFPCDHQVEALKGLTTCAECQCSLPNHSPNCPRAQAQPMTAADFLEKGLGHMKDRAATYDAPAGERSMAKTVAMYNALTGQTMTEEQGWKFMCCLKLARSEQGGFRADNFEDLAAYAGLAGEAASNDHH